MYIALLKLWNFRKYGSELAMDLNKPSLEVHFSKGLNVLIGENDSGKSSILDAIKLALKTHSQEWIKVERTDFYNDCTEFRIEIIFKGLKIEEARHFTEWLGWEGDGVDAQSILKLIYKVERNGNKIIPSELCAGMDDVGLPLNALAREYLKTTYLKALRDADHELIAKRNSRVSQILQGHDLLKCKDENNHELEEVFQVANNSVKDWFTAPENYNGIKKVIDGFIKAFIDDSLESEIIVSNADIVAILEKLSIGIGGKMNLGLGSLNRLYMAVELLHLKKENWDGARVCLIEELEAHLHPHAQMKVIEALKKESDVQFILTTHSPNLAAKTPLESLLICSNNQVYPMGSKYTKLKNESYKYLEHFLDVTRSSLFFAKGVIIVEGWSEQILLPIIANFIGCDLTKHEVSIINVGSTAYSHFAGVFARNDAKSMGVKVSVITDLDIKPDIDGNFNAEKESNKTTSICDGFSSIANDDIKIFIAKQWTLEWCLYKSSSLSVLFKDSVRETHSNTPEFKYKDDKGCVGYEYKDEYEGKLIAKLAKMEGTSPLDKVDIAQKLATKITNISDDDVYLQYLINAIKHACNIV